MRQFENRLIPSLEPFDLMFRNFFDTDSFFTPVLDCQFKYPVDIIETEKGLKYEIATPGLTEDDVKIDVTDGNILTVSYNKETKEESKNEKFIHRGIAKRAFSMGWRIGNKWDLSKIEASMENGLLTVEIPYSPEEKPKQIAIKSKNKK
jgi:HSP20 family molecular chaperone IbpA